MHKIPSSFRDPSGFVFEHANEIYRNIDQSYHKHYERLLSSGLLDQLFENSLLVKHVLVSPADFSINDSIAIIKPEKIPIITYPYEWCFSQLKDAALLTLSILKISLGHGMILKDASAYNVQFNGYKPIFIDTLSFAIYEEGQSWTAYRQFCEHFLAPLCLGSFLGVTFQSLSRLGVDGIPLKMASRLLPRTTWFNPAALMHIHLHAKTMDFYSNKVKSGSIKKKAIRKKNLLAMIDHLMHFIEGLQLNRSDKTQWQHYDKETHYSDTGRESKASIVKKLVDKLNAAVVWDLGANDGFFSRSIAKPGRLILSLDSDLIAIEKNFRYAKQKMIPNICALIFDVVNPSPDLGWANQERRQLTHRSKPDVIMALALIHHIVITFNVPFINVAEYFASVAEWLIIEFVPRQDDKIAALPDTAGKTLYSRENFDVGFYSVFTLVAEEKIEGSERSLLLLKRI